MFFIIDDQQQHWNIRWFHELFLCFVVFFLLFSNKKEKLNHLLFHISDQVQSSISKYSIFGKRIKPTSSRCSLVNANGPLQNIKLFTTLKDKRTEFNDVEKSDICKHNQSHDLYNGNKQKLTLLAYLIRRLKRATNHYKLKSSHESSYRKMQVRFLFWFCDLCFTSRTCSFRHIHVDALLWNHLYFRGHMNWSTNFELFLFFYHTHPSPSIYLILMSKKKDRPCSLLVSYSTFVKHELKGSVEV